ncbi:hypothetical protein LEN26_013853 [Aphanomyces euteiches]|nr:hypothetical protein LEN26_013853 [Aphanomyces euteiches]
MAKKHRRLDVEAVSAVLVLRSFDLMIIIVAFQDGLYHDGHKLLESMRWSAFRKQGITYVFPHLSRLPFHVLLSWLQEHGAARLGHVLSYIKRESSMLPVVVFCVAVYYGDLGILTYIEPDCRLRTGLDFTVAMDVAAACGHLDIVKWLHYNRCEGCSTNAMDKAALGGHVDVVDWFHSNRQEGFSSQLPEIMKEVVARGHLPMVSWLNHHRTRQWPRGLMDAAAARGQLDMLAFFHHETKKTCSTDAMDLAAAYGHLTVVAWLHSHRQEGCTTQAMDSAAGQGHLEIVQFLHIHRNEGCTTLAMDAAASNGHFAMVQWLHNNRSEGCTWKAIYYAAAHNHVKIVRWLKKRRPDVERRAAVTVAQTQGLFQIVSLLAPT